MGYRELFLILGGVVMMSLITASVNRTFFDGRETLQEAQIAHIATGVAQGFIEEGRAKKFDTFVATASEAGMPGNFTNYYQLGPGSGEAYPNIDDVDDFNGLNQTISVGDIDFEINIQVGYVNDTAPDVFVQANTFYKTMVVEVSSSYLRHPVTLKHVYSYFGVVPN